jgi:hypothetical protein
MLFVGERRRSRRLPGAIRRERSEQIKHSGSCGAVLRRREPTCFSSASDDEVGGFLARSAASGASNQIKHSASSSQKLGVLVFELEVCDDRTRG